MTCKVLDMTEQHWLTQWQSRKTLSLPPLMRKWKPQLSTEQLLMKKTTNYQKRFSGTKDIKKEKGGGTDLWYNQIPRPPGGCPTDWREIMLQTFSHRSESSEPHIRIPSPGLQHGEDKPPQNIWLWRPLGLNCRSLTGLGERLHSKGITTSTCTRSQRKSNNWLGAWPGRSDLPAGLGEFPGKLGRWLWLTLGTSTMAAGILGSIQTHEQYCWWLPSWLISTKTWPHPTDCRCQRWDASGQKTNWMGR